MTIKEWVRQKDNDTLPEKKIKRPQNWRIILYYETKEPVACCACLLQDVFRMSTDTAVKHTLNARDKGREIVFEAPQDAAQTKAAEAEKERSRRSVTCSPGMKFLRFLPEPSAEPS